MDSVIRDNLFAYRIERKMHYFSRKTAILAATALFVVTFASTAEASEYREFHRNGSLTGTTWDTYIDEGSPTSNYLSADPIYVGGTNKRAILIWFPYAVGGSAAVAVPFGAKIDNAKLTLRTYTFGSLDNHYIVQMLSEWAPNTVSWDKAHAKKNWAEPGTQDGTDYIFRDQVPVIPPSPDTSYAFNVTDIVQAWADGQSNYGFAIGGAQLDWSNWYSEASGTEAYRPKLEVWFSWMGGNLNNFVANPGTYSTCNCTYIRSDIPGTPRGSETMAYINSDPNSYLKKMLIAWPNFTGSADGQVHTGATVYHARQNLYTLGATIESLSIYHIFRPWVESQATWGCASLGSAWNAPGMQNGSDYASDPATGSFTPNYAPVFYGHNLTRDVMGYVKFGAPNYGWVIQIEHADPTADCASIQTDNYIDPNYRPSLSVFWGNPTGGSPPDATNVKNPYDSHEMPFYDIRYCSTYVDGDGPGGVFAVRYRTQICNDVVFNTGIVWDSGFPFIGPLSPGQNSGWIKYMGPTLESGVTHYFRMRYYTNYHDDGTWSTTVPFRAVESMHTCTRKGYHMLKLCADTQGRTAQELFGDNVPALIIYEYNELARSWDTPTTLDLTKGYFIWSPTNQKVSFGANGDLFEDSFINIPLSYTNIHDNASDGWNLIRNPYFTDGEYLDSVSHLDGSGYDPILYHPWNGTQYSWFNTMTEESGNGGQRNIEPGRSFWVRANSGGAYVNLYHPKSPGAPAPRPLPPPILTWRMMLSAETDIYIDNATYISVREGASEDYDYADVFEMTPMSGGYILAFFEHNDWGGYAGRYTQDTRPYPVDGQSVTWNATVVAWNASNTVELDWEIPPEAAGWDLIMKDETSGEIVDLNVAENYIYAADGPDTREFTITVTRHGDSVLGDADGDGALTLIDAQLTAQAEHGIVTIEEPQNSLCDLDSSGEVDVLDSLLILKTLKGYLSRGR
ncbi:MAG: DNRLRE domain-containing protein [Planctomycetota bacterium]